MKNQKFYSFPLLVAGSMLVSACFHDDDVAKSSFDVTVSNITNAQPLTPVAVVLHTSAYSAWSVGETASSGLEVLAESGDPSLFLSEADDDSSVSGTAASDSGPFAPGTSQTVSLRVNRNPALQISVASMLANTNDAFTGISNIPVGDLQMGESMIMMAHVYDAGTEANSETAGSMPGPAAGGEGFNSARDDRDFVAIHAGVVTSDDGLATSVLNETHRWNSLAAKIVITRTK